MLDYLGSKEGDRGHGLGDEWSAMSTVIVEHGPLNFSLTKLVGDNTGSSVELMDKFLLSRLDVIGVPLNLKYGSENDFLVLEEKDAV